MGLGHIGQRHIRVMEQLPEAALVATIDPIAPPYKDIPHFISWEDFQKSGIEADMITIATPNHTHAPLAEQALRAGYHAVVEKPLMIDPKDGSRLISAQRESGKSLFLVMQNRFSPLVQWLKSVVDQQKLGTIFMVQINCFWNRGAQYYTPNSWRGKADQDGGVLLTQFSHYVDILYWLMGDFSVSSSKNQNYLHQGITDFSDSGIVTLSFKNGAMGSFCYTTAAFEKNMESSLTILGEKGSIKLMGPYMDQLAYAHWDGNDTPDVCAENPLLAVPKNVQDNHLHYYKHILAVMNHDSKPLISTEEGIRVVELIRQMEGI